MSKKSNKTSEELLSEINEKLDKILGVMATQGKNIDTQIAILHGFGWKWEDVGKMVGMTGDATKMRYSRKQSENKK